MRKVDEVKPAESLIDGYCPMLDVRTNLNLACAVFVAARPKQLPRRRQWAWLARDVLQAAVAWP